MRERYLLIAMFVLFAVDALVSSSYARIDMNSVVAIYLFEDISDDVLIDASENGRDVPIVGDGELVDSADIKYGNALNVTRSTFAQLEGTEAEDFNLETMTITAWINATGSGHRIATCKGSAGPTRNFYVNFNINDQFVLGHTPTLNLANGRALELERWYHFAGTHDGQTKKVYVDGVLEAEAPHALPEPNDQPFTVGGGVSGQYPFNDCMMDELLIAKVAFSQEDINAIMNEGLEKAAALTAVSSAGKLTSTWGQMKAE